MQDIATIPFRDVRHLAPIPSRSRVGMCAIPAEDGAHARRTSGRRKKHMPHAAHKMHKRPPRNLALLIREFINKAFAFQ